MNARNLSLCLLYLFIGSFCIYQSCVNSIDDDEDNSASQKIVEVRINSQALYNQVYNSNYKSEIGLYILEETTSLDTKWHIANEKLICNSNEFVSLNNIYYPSEGKSTILSYYPYQEPAIQENGIINVGVLNDQSHIRNYNESDFMVAIENSINPTTKIIKLNYEHLFSQLNITIKAEEHIDIEQLKNENPIIHINNLFSSASYNIQTNDFLYHNTPVQIIPYGEWSIVGNKLKNKVALIVPQTIMAFTEFISLNIGEKQYTVSLSENYDFISGKSNEIVLLYTQETGVTSLTATINQWEEGSNIEIIPTEIVEKERLSFDDFDFNQSNVYQIFSQGQVVAEVCKEYLVNDHIQNVAIVVYPVKNSKPILESGYVWHIGEQQSNEGSVVWNQTNNSFDYVSSNQNSPQFIYIDTNLQIHTKQPQNALSISTKPYIWVDNRIGETICYPIVKIGTQHWFQDDLKTTVYKNGNPIKYKSQTNYIETEAGYFTNAANVFYNQKAMETGEIAPNGWRVANYEDWQKLSNYLNKNASTLKATNSWGAKCQSNNLAGFNAHPKGIFNIGANSNKSVYSFGKDYLVYWSAGNTQNTLWTSAILLKSDSDEIKEASYTEFSGYCIRCIKE